MKVVKLCPKCGGRLRKIQDIKIKLPDSGIELHTKTTYRCMDCFKLMAWVYLYKEWQFGRNIWSM